MRFIIPIIIGAIIGYITNWLAIKMLFRPQYRKEIFGIHIPFTPGLIPKEKDRIAKSIGDAVGMYLLSPEVLTETLSGEELNGKLRTTIKENFDKLKNDNKTIFEILEGFLGEKYESIVGKIEKEISDFIFLKISNRDFQDKLMYVIQDKILIKNKNELRGFVIEKLKYFIRKFANFGETKEGIDKFIILKSEKLECDIRTLDSILPHEIKQLINNYIKSHKKEIYRGLKQAIDNPFVKRKLKASITEIVSQNTNKIIAVFMTPESVAQKVISSLEVYLDEDENDDSIILFIMALVNKLFETKISDVFRGVTEENKSMIVLELSNIVSNIILNEETQSMLTGMIEKKMVESEQTILKGLIDFLDVELRTIINAPGLNEKIHKIVHWIIETSINKPVSLLLKDINDESISNIASISKDIFNIFVISKLPKIIDVFDVSKVVEDKITTFDVDFLEKMIIDISKKELRAITWLGALLGGIMGLISPLLQLLI